jgi:hypothetical protein
MWWKKERPMCSLRLKTEQRLRGYSYGIDCSGHFSENAFCA